MTPANIPRAGSRRLSRTVAFAALMGYAAWLVFPMVWVAYSSLKGDDAIFSNVLALPAASALHTDNYARAWKGARFGDYFINSVVVTALSVALIVALGSMAAYALAEVLPSRGTNRVRTHDRGSDDSRAAGGGSAILRAALPRPPRIPRTGLVLVYTANGLPFAIFILAGFFRTLPRSLYEAAIVDGCGEFSAFWRVLLPLARPGLVTVAIFQFIGVWREYFYAFMLVSGDSSGAARTIPLGLANLSIAAEYRTEYGMLFAGIILVTLPILVVYVALQRQIVRGIAAGALKG